MNEIKKLVYDTNQLKGIDNFGLNVLRDGINAIKKIESLEIRYANAPKEKTNSTC